MSLFKKGETSDAVKAKKLIITQSIISKAELLDKINSHSDIPSTLTCGFSGFSLASINKWNDASLKVISCSYNTAKAEHNIDAQSQLSDSIVNVNRRLKGTEQSISTSDKMKPSRMSVDAVDELRKDNEGLKVALAEVYRAYMQLLDSFREDEEIDKAYRKLILEQARILGANRITEVK